VSRQAELGREERLLELVGEYPGRTLTELARALGCSPPAARSLLETAESRGLVHRASVTRVQTRTGEPYEVTVWRPAT
jgi:DNA-binding IclR family transcriptional regulator